MIFVEYFSVARFQSGLEAPRNIRIKLICIIAFSLSNLLWPFSSSDKDPAALLEGLSMVPAQNELSSALKISIRTPLGHCCTPPLSTIWMPNVCICAHRHNLLCQFGRAQASELPSGTRDMSTRCYFSASILFVLLTATARWLSLCRHAVEGHFL